MAQREGSRKGEVPDVYVTLREGVEESADVRDRVVSAVEDEIGAFTLSVWLSGERWRQSLDDRLN